MNFPLLQWWASALLGAFLIAQMVTGWGNSGFVRTFLIAAICICSATLWLQRKLKKGSQVQAKERPPHMEDYETAKLLVLRELSNPERFSTSGPWKGDFSLQLDSAISDLLHRFGSIRINHGDLAVGPEFLKKSRYVKGGIAIGIDTDSTEVVSIPGHDTVFVSDGSESSLEEMEQYESVFHLFLNRIREIYGN